MASNYHRLTYTVDIVFCIDSTGSMDNVIDIVKENALHFYDDLMKAMEEKNKSVNSVRIKIISFRDYLADGKDAMMATDFFTLPEQSAEFSNTVQSIEAFGGGDEPEDGLEALAFAIRSKWSTEGTKKRQIIVMWSDASAHPLGYGSSSPYYPKSMAKNFSELTDWWGDRQNQPYINYSAKRLILYTPKLSGWDEIIRNWDGVVHYPSEAGKGLENLDYQEILSSIVQSV
ncbi:MAG: VWA domain-containing protein [Oscillospiraceae bacterium]|nr:VWA domain-containing protein [Oscillospiraceae bacterium]